MEERTLLNNRFVVPVGVPVDNTTNFATLQAALTTSGLSAGDVIQIEPKSAPGNVTATGPAVANLTIQGDPASDLSTIPQFTFSSSFTVATAQAGFTLRNVNVGLVSSGSLVLDANATIASSAIVDVSATDVFPLILGGTSDVLTNTTVVNNAAVGNGLVEIATPSGGSSNLISDNTFVAAASASILVSYAGGTGTTATDSVLSNSFVDNAGVTVGALLALEESVSGLTIENNTFSGPAETGIYQTNGTPTNLQLIGNTIDLTQSPATGIELTGGGAGTTVSAVLGNNQIATSGIGTGIYIAVGSASTSALNLKIQGNDLHNNQFGVFITSGPGPVTGIDLGGGSQGSVGDNNFRSFTANATPSSGAIFVSNVSVSQGTISAQHNLFATGVTPSNVVSDPHSNLNLSNPLSANAAFVATVYNDFLKRPGDTTNAQDAGYWVTRLNAGTITTTAVVNAILNSAEGLGVLVNGLYEKILGRTADAGGQASFVALLQNGGTVEQVATILVTSSEYTSEIGSDASYVQSLYVKFLGRIGSNAEISGWVAQMPTMGRAAAATFILSSSEFRTDLVQQLYGDPIAPAPAISSIFSPLLHRATQPAASETSGWVQSSLGALALTAAFAETGEFFTNG